LGARSAHGTVAAPCSAAAYSVSNQPRSSPLAMESAASCHANAVRVLVPAL
jgi:hypothetical protein